MPQMRGGLWRNWKERALLEGSFGSIITHPGAWELWGGQLGLSLSPIDAMLNVAFTNPRSNDFLLDYYSVEFRTEGAWIVCKTLDSKNMYISDSTLTKFTPIDVHDFNEECVKAIHPHQTIFGIIALEFPQTGLDALTAGSYKWRPQSKIHEGYSPSSRLAIRPAPPQSLSRSIFKTRS